MKTRHVVIVANGELHSPRHARDVVENADYRIAADGGFAHFVTMGLFPHLLIGDLDSVTPEQLHLAQDNGCEIRQFPTEKDETDLELALMAAIETESEKITILAALGGKMDQMLANIFLMSLPQLSQLDVRIDDGNAELLLVNTSLDLLGSAGDTISLLSLSPVAYGVTTIGLKYPLNHENLFFYHSRGISNLMLENLAQITVESGSLLCIHNRSEEIK